MASLSLNCIRVSLFIYLPTALRSKTALCRASLAVKQRRNRLPHSSSVGLRPGFNFPSEKRELRRGSGLRSTAAPHSTRGCPGARAPRPARPRTARLPQRRGLQAGPAPLPPADSRSRVTSALHSLASSSSPHPISFPYYYYF